MLIAVFMCIRFAAEAQELFVFTEPASNMAARSLGVRLNNYFVKERNQPGLTAFIIPEVMMGVSKKVMVHADLFTAANSRAFAAQGGSLYAKFRFLSHDDVQEHFRMSAFGRFSFNNSAVDHEDVNLYGFNSGYEGGIVATRLLHKLALSSGLSFVKAIDNEANKLPYSGSGSRAINYTFSAGRLVLPAVYTDYRQTNLNLMLELLGQYNPGSGKYYVDLAPSVQFIFNSVARVDLGYRQQLGSTLNRIADGGFFLRFEYNFFNIY